MAKDGSLESELRKNFTAARAHRNVANAVPLAAADRMAVRAYQQERLARTHGDLLESAQFGPPHSFFSPSFIPPTT